MSNKFIKRLFKSQKYRDIAFKCAFVSLLAMAIVILIRLSEAFASTNNSKLSFWIDTFCSASSILVLFAIMLNMIDRLEDSDGLDETKKKEKNKR
jgi:hypothetical protein